MLPKSTRETAMKIQEKKAYRGKTTRERQGAAEGSRKVMLRWKRRGQQGGSCQNEWREERKGEGQRDGGGDLEVAFRGVTIGWFQKMRGLESGNQLCRVPRDSCVWIDVWTIARFGTHRNLDITGHWNHRSGLIQATKGLMRWSCREFWSWILWNG